MTLFTWAGVGSRGNAAGMAAWVTSLTALLSAGEDLPPEGATDAQMWCRSDAPSPDDESPQLPPSHIWDSL